MATVTHTWFIFAMVNGQLQIIKKLKPADGECFKMSDDMIERGGFIVDWSEKPDSYIQYMRATFDPTHPQYQSSKVTQTVNPPLPYTAAIATQQEQRVVQQSAVGAAWDFSKLPKSEHDKVKAAYVANDYTTVQNTLESYGVFSRSCSSCGLNKTTKKWMDWAINSGTI